MGRKPCNQCGVPTGKGRKYCKACTAKMSPNQSVEMGGLPLNSQQKGYTNKAWREFRSTYLAEHPICEAHEAGLVLAPCSSKPITKPRQVIAATVLDHIIPIDPTLGERDPLFFLKGNHQALCDFCHNQKRYTEKNGKGVALRSQFKTREQASGWLKRLKNGSNGSQAKATTKQKS